MGIHSIITGSLLSIVLFARWVWGRAGAAHTSELTAGEATSYEYGARYKTLHDERRLGRRER